MIGALVIDSLLVKGLRFVLGRINDAVDAELGDESTLREQLLEAQMKYELGEITEEEMADVEREVIARMRELQPEQTGAISMVGGQGSADVEVSLSDDDDSDRSGG